MKKLFLLLVAVLSIGLCASAQTRTVRGTVLDADNGEPLPGVSVSAGHNLATVTDIDGAFIIKAPENARSLTFSMVGFETLEAPIPSTGEMTVRMSSQSTQLEEVVATAYGTPKKAGNIVGSVSVVGTATLENIPTPNFVDALQGQIAGLSIMSNSGDPSSVSNEVRLRGVNSLNGGNTPLYILDGAPVNQNVFITLNPADIESVAVLKDAASLAIYGSRAANGVIVITSKKGAYSQKPKFTLRATVGWSNMASDKMEMMDSRQYIQYRDLINQPVTQEIRDLVNKYGINTDWADEMFSNAGTYSVEASLQGGSEYVSYYLSLNHMDQDGIIVKSGMRRETIRTSIESKINDWFRVGFQGNLGYSKYETNNQVTQGDGVYSSSPTVFARKALPYDSPYYYTIGENGQIKYGEKAQYLHYTGLLTPEYYATDWMGGNRNRVTFNGAFYEQITPIKGLTIRAQQAVDAFEQRNNIIYKPVMEDLVTPMGDVYPAADQLGSGRNSQGFQRYYQFTYTNTAEYNFTIKDVHNASVLIGEESLIMNNNAFSVYTEGQTDLRQMLLQQGTSIKIDNVSQTLQSRTQNSIFANASYNYDYRYFIDLSYRRDGSSKFAPGHRWANFYSVGLMWNAKNENFLQPVTWLDDLRVRLSHGTTGNSAGIDDYAYFGLVGSYRIPYNGSPAIGVSQAPNHDLTWETVATTDAGVSFGIFKILKGEIDFYHKKTTDMLMDIPYSFTTGFASGSGNIATMTNTGVDVDLKANIISTRDWMWAVNVNFNYNKNKITALFNDRDAYTIPNTGLRYEVGHDAGEFYYVEFAGVDPRDGRQMWYDKNGNLTKVYNEEVNSVMTGKSRYAPWSGGFGTDLRYKWFSLHVDFMWAAKKYMVNNDRYFIENNTNATSWNQMTTMLDVWTTPGQITDIPKYGEEIQFDSHLLEDATFMRLKNLTFQYTMPKNLVKKAGFENVSFRFTGRNLLTFTGYSGYDPEPGTNIVAFWYPNTRQYEFGVDITF
ncbi:MAG: TonB-dependent receptor [Muribaculaceae bacterium]|nr:TonB-dependent receptor [Muribaculaceae bacterium]